MKKIALIVAILLGAFASTVACNITFTLQNDQNETVNPAKVKVGDTYTLVVHFKPTHRVCPIDIKSTKFNLDGIKVISATDWASDGGTGYIRKVKIKISDNKKPESSLTVVRLCDNGGCSAPFIVKK